MPNGIDIKLAAKGAFLGGAIAGVICVALYFVGGAIGADYRPRDPAALGGLEKLLFFQPMVNCLIAAAVSVAMLAILNKVAPARAWYIYLGIAVVVFLGEAYAPFWAFADMKTIAILELMHVPAALGVVGGIHRFAIKA